MPSELTNAEKIRRLPWNIALGATNSVFAQLTFFGSAYVLFLNQLGASNSQIGFLLSLMPFCGIVALFIAPAAARFGYKRTFVTFFGIRKFISAGLLLTPWVLAQFGIEAAIGLVGLVTFGFALCRAIAEVGFYPWSQEFIPNSMRGKHSALNDMVARITGTIAIAVAGIILGLSAGLDRFMILFGIAFAFGLMAVWSATHIPGGAPTKAEAPSYRDLFRVFKDRNFTRYMVGLGLVTLGSAPLAFLPLFMQSQIGLDDSAVVWLQIGTIVGGFSATYLFGWAADRYGSKPILLTGLYVKTLLPIGFLLIPRYSSVSLAAALIVSFVWGIAEIGWAIGSGRLLFVKVVPHEKRGEYLAMFYAAIGIIGGLSQIISGWLLDASARISGQFLGLPIDQFAPLFLGGVVLTGIGIILFNSVQADSDVSVAEFAGMFVHGNPLLALESLVRYHRSTGERATIAVTERMGLTKSPLTVEELLETLEDPRFNVRFEAIISMARMGNDPRLVEALCEVVDGTELSLSVIAAWALGRIGDEHALPALRNGLNSPYRSIQAHCARSLGTLRDTEVAPLLLERLRAETDKGLRIAYASALGNLKWEPALATLFQVLEETENEGARREMALAIARIVGGEQHFIRLLRRLRVDPGTTASQALMTFKRKLPKTSELRGQIDQCADLFARDQADEGAKLLSQIIGSLPRNATCRSQVLVECARTLQTFGGGRQEYILLTLHTLQVPERRD